MAREEIIDLGIKLDDAKEIIEERLKPTPSLQVQFGETEALIEEKDKIIGQLESKVKARDKELNANDDHVEELEQKIEEKDQIMAMQRQQINNLAESKANRDKEWDERNVQQPGLPGIKRDDPIHDKILDLILDSEVAKRNKLTEDAMDLVGVRELMVYTINQQIKYNETHKDPEYDAELANGDGQDTSIDEQVANNQPYREGDE